MTDMGPGIQGVACLDEEQRGVSLDGKRAGAQPRFNRRIHFGDGHLPHGSGVAKSPFVDECVQGSIKLQRLTDAADLAPL